MKGRMSVAGCHAFCKRAFEREERRVGRCGGEERGKGGAKQSINKGVPLTCSLSSTASTMPSFPSPLTQTPYPALYLYPLNDSFVPKHIALLPNQRVKIGRQTNAKTVPAERNGYFDSKVLSRQHAEVWEEGGKVRGPIPSS